MRADQWPGQMNVVRFSTLDGLRGLLAWWVVTAHLLSRAGFHRDSLPDYLHTFRAGNLAVDVFIIMSGFVIAHLLLAKSEPYNVFIVRRFFRLYPVYILAFAAAATLHQTHVWVLQEVQQYSTSARASSLIKQYQEHSEHTLAHILAHIPMLHGLFDPVLPRASTAFLGTAWSISLEWQFYLLAPALVLAIRRHQIIALAVILLCAIVAQMFRVGGSAFLPNSLAWFGIGIATALIIHGRGNISATVFIGGFAATLLCFSKWNAWAGPHIPLTVWALAVATMLGRLGMVAGILNNPAVQHLGRISYSTYLWHMIALVLVQAVLFTIHQPSSAIDLFIATAIPTIGLTWIMSAASYRWIEAPGVRMGASYSRLESAQVDSPPIRIK